MTESRSLEPLRSDLRERVFRMGQAPLKDRVGLELEYLVRRDCGGDPVRLEGPGGIREAMEEMAGQEAWRLVTDSGSVPRWEAPCGCSVTFEPGGQVEVASPPVDSLEGVFECLSEVAGPLRQRFADRGWRLLSVGVDPVHSASAVELELASERYARMAEHFRRLGPAGRRMMRQTASVHINVDLGDRPEVRWRVANALAPVLTAVFANSAVYEGAASGYRNYRAWQWRMLDPTRTGIPGTGRDPVEEYLRFALAAPAILAGAADQPAEPFWKWWERGVGLEAWYAHLSTLFPEVRPRGYLELRSVDLLPEQWLPVPVAFVLGILYSEASLARAARELPPATERSLRTAARRGLADAEIREAAAVAWRLALRGMTELPEVVSERQRDLAVRFEATFTRRGRDPGNAYEDAFASVEAGA